MLLKASNKWDKCENCQDNAKVATVAVVVLTSCSQFDQKLNVAGGSHSVSPVRPGMAAPATTLEHIETIQKLPTNKIVAAASTIIAEPFSAVVGVAELD